MTELIKPGYTLDELPNNIRARREKCGISNSDLADLCDVTPGTVNAWETKHSTIKLGFALKIAGYLECTTEVLFPQAPASYFEALRQYDTTVDNTANNIAKIRDSRNLTLEALAQQLSTSITTIHNLETGVIPLSRQWGDKLGKALNCDPEDLRNENTPPFFEAKEPERMPNTVRERRQAAGFTLKALSDNSGVPVKNIHELEAYEKPVSPDELKMLAKALSCQVGDLLYPH